VSGSHRPIVFTLNGKRRLLRVHPLKRLLDVLREDCGLTGTKEGCGEGECGACTVIVDGRAVNSCLVPAGQVSGAKVSTIEGLKGRHPLQRAFAEFGGAQCGICTPGMVMAAVALGPRPTLDEARAGLAGNICRCTGYEGIYRAIRKTEARSKKQEAGRQKTGDRGQKTEGGRRKEPVPTPAPERRTLREPRGRRVEARVPGPEARAPIPRRERT
jgi:carbon-monoxide dehydrogenase small subunit/xanthine dehydrogenase small subunit